MHTQEGKCRSKQVGVIDTIGVLYAACHSNWLH